MSFFENKERDVELLMSEHIGFVKDAVSVLVELFESYFSGEETYRTLSKKIHHLEHEADKVRRKIEQKLHEGAFLAMFREDFIRLSEAIDKIANKAEAVADSLTLEKPEFPKEWHEDVLQLTKMSAATFAPFLEIRDLLDTSLENILEIARKIEDAEQFVDKIEWRLLEKVFNSELDLAHKLQLRDFVKRIAAISDLSEDASDVLEILVVKRRI